jgi:uncharacterized protein (TIGR02646 family)
MVFVYRNKILKPDFFSSKEYENNQIQLAKFYEIDLKKRAQKRFLDFEIPNAVVSQLKGLFNDKCAYCETKVRDSKSNLYIDHFRPRENAKGFKNDETDLDHYWWLSYEWNNLYFICIECNSYKSSWFPVEGKRAKVLTKYSDIVEQENNLIIDPCNDEIEKHLRNDFRTGKLIPLSRKGETTIQILQLNRNNLVNRRLEAIQEEVKNWDMITTSFFKNKILKRTELIDYWEGLSSRKSNVEFLGARRALLFNKLVNNKAIAEPIEFFFNTNESVFPPLEKTNNKEFNKSNRLQTELKKYVDEQELPEIQFSGIKEILKNIYLRKIVLKNYKCFDSITIDLETKRINKREPWLVFLGENGVGKSSLIKAIAIALMGQDYLDSLGLDPNKILKYGKKSGYIKLFGTNNDEVYKVSFNIDSKKLISSIKESPCYLLAYGSTRLLPKGQLLPEDNVDFVKAKNLFDYSISLSDARTWLLEISAELFVQVARSLKLLMLLDQDDIIVRGKGDSSLYIQYSKEENRIDIEDLSDGYKSVFALTVDIIKTLSKDNLAFENAEAVVLIDEIGAHLHPRWKMEVVPKLRDMFPKIQFIITTHEPLCLRGLQKNEVLVLKRGNENEIIAINDLPDPSELRVDQLLTSEYFGLNSTLDFETESQFREYYDLLAKENKTPDEENRVSELNQILPNKKHLGDDIRDELVYFVIDELLAKQVKKHGFKIVDEELKQSALDRVKDIWKFIDSND